MTQSYKPVKILNPQVARKIAAGEVIDRPAAIVRELLDNAADAGAESVTVELEGGGIDKIRIVDDGGGMTKEDMENCARPHATSKISSEDDLLTLSTLGFRGEALSSIAAVCRLEITSVREGCEAWKLETRILSGTAAEHKGQKTDAGEAYMQEAEHRLSPARLLRGTIVQAAGLFENFPARRMFLKRPASEGQLCRQTVIEKALPRPDITFRFFSDGKQKFVLTGGGSLKDRCIAALEPSEPDIFFYQQEGSGSGFSFSVILGRPEVVRNDRRHLMVFINGRRIWEYSLVQALEYGAQGYFPNGTHPFACLFLQIDPALIDFNIHPAKKEARFKDIGPIHKAVSGTVRSFFKNLAVSSLVRETVRENTGLSAEDRGLFEKADTAAAPGRSYPDYTPADGTSALSGGKAQKGSYGPGDGASGYSFGKSGTRMPFGGTVYSGTRKESPYAAYARLTEQIPRNTGGQNSAETSVPETVQTESPVMFRYLGQVMGVFLAVEKDGVMYFIDQHAAHERILFNQIMEGAGKRQELLIPYRIETDSEADDAYIESIAAELTEAGFSLKNEEDGSWLVFSVPERWTGTEEDLTEDLLKQRIKPGELIYALAAYAACRSAVKDGDVLDSDTAHALLEQTFALPDPHCPHGRPVWTALRRDELFSLVKRT